ncbi:GAF and ANTAR domain-containing protein [Arthrobacter sp. E3]|uniref:GAF and ANTAR domain-containing protein n=1 Tax=Arthrobacter sp. E3 TaxID=517402 RepID=UPI001A94FF54|nr:GAF and ANTAR domain-containing protein [Arthrobacter sp. E3]
MRTMASEVRHPQQDQTSGRLGAPLWPAHDNAGPTISTQLQDMVLDSLDVGDFLQELAEYSGGLAAFNGQPRLDCAITLYRRRKVPTGAGNTKRARALNEIQEYMAHSACMTALREGRTVVISDTASDKTWPEYAQTLLKEGVHSVLSVPLSLGHEASASLNFFSSETSFFNEGLVVRAQQYAAQAQKALRLAVRIGSKQQLVDELYEARNSRTAIDLSVGIIMGQQHCSQADAFELLSRAASSRNQKLRDVAENLLHNVDVHAVETHFERWFPTRMLEDMDSMGSMAQD